MPASPAAALLAAVFWLAAPTALAQGFSFSTPDEAAKREREAREARITHDLSTPCRADLRNKKIMVVIGETQSGGHVTAQQADYGPHYRVINDRLRALGLTTYSAEEIRRQVAQAEIDAHFRNDPDAALSASRRLGANFILRGLIATRSAPNPMMRVNQVDVTMGFTLTSSAGKLISTADARSASYAGADTSRMALTLIEEQADEVVAKLYAEYCRNAGFEPAPTPATKRK